jgi:DNA end-binding protein Ku
MSDADFENLPVSGSQELEVVEFVPNDQVDPVLYDRSYYLEPDQSALKPYVLLREALGRTDRTAVLKVVLRKRTQLAALRVRGDVLLLQTMRWPDEVRAAAFDVLDGEVTVKAAESKMADRLVESLASNFEPGEFTDEYREALLGVIEGKVAGGQATEPAADQPETGEADVLDLMTALRASVERSKAARAGDDSAAEAKSAAAPARKKTAKKSAKKAAPAAKKTAKKSAKKAAPSRKTA